MNYIKYVKKIGDTKEWSLREVKQMSCILQLLNFLNSLAQWGQIPVVSGNLHDMNRLRV